MVEIKMSVNDAGRRKLGNWFTHLLGKSKRLPRVLREILYGMTVYKMDLELRREVLFDATFTLYYSFHRDMEEKSFERERPD